MTFKHIRAVPDTGLLPIDLGNGLIHLKDAETNMIK